MSLSAARSYGHTPRKLPRQASNLPHHRSAPLQALDYCTTGAHRKSSTFLPGRQSFFTVFALLAKSRLCNIAKRRPAWAGRRLKPFGAHARFRRALAPFKIFPLSFNKPRPSRPCAWRSCHSRHTRRPNAPAGRGCTGDRKSVV